MRQGNAWTSRCCDMQKIAAAEAALGEQVGIWRAMIVVLDSGEHCPHHFRGRKQ